ncbi:conserved hypothetical protein [Microsporum canis CBS 113480]|uniref:Uncharacterized protein n=1 Tax=Arthroderma otae (strain ATCC MYA-4605 / CBS 113480) TaxID=554155 RepID=C5FN42_ARTOC|nr:conserved hypothetical protein [Microsporum canis CBS 113480]EEQ31278.1 conserved hypothetical protein [Microsporum canis CBS 113480]
MRLTGESRIATYYIDDLTSSNTFKKAIERDFERSLKLINNERTPGPVLPEGAPDSDLPPGGDTGGHPLDLVLYQPGRIVKQILRTSIPDDGFIDDYFESLKKIPRPNLSLSEAVALEDYNRLVNNFARDFARRALSKHPITRVEEKCPWPVTERESYRILRAFYRFELYWKLFQGTEKPRGERHRQLTIPLKDHSKLFFDRFAPWENEQVACIQDFLLRLIDERECLKERILTTLSLVYNDVAAHDVEWGEADIPFNEGYEAGTSTISLGLMFIHRLRVTKKYHCRLELLNAHRRFQLASIDQALKPHELWFTDRVPLSKYSDEQIKRLIQTPNIRGHRGPIKVWGITHLNLSSSDFVMADEHIPLRERGYVMWSYDRLKKWGCLKVPGNHYHQSHTTFLMKRHMRYLNPIAEGHRSG